MNQLERIPPIDETACMEIAQGSLPELAMISSDIPHEMLAYQVRKAMREFTDRSRTQLRKVEIQLTPCVKEYKITLPCGEEFVSFQEDHRHNGLKSSITQFGRYQVKWDVSTCHVEVSPDPCDDVPIRISVATKPSIESCLVDAKLYHRYYDTLMYGAKSYLYAMTGDDVEWANGTLAAFNDQKFQAGITAAATDKILDYHSGPFNLPAPRVI